MHASQLESGIHETCDRSDGELEGTRRGRRTRRRGKSKHSGLVSVRQIAAKVCRQLEFLPERDEWAQSVVVVPGDGISFEQEREREMG